MRLAPCLSKCRRLDGWARTAVGRGGELPRDEWNSVDIQTKRLICGRIFNRDIGCGPSCGYELSAAAGCSIINLPSTSLSGLVQPPECPALSLPPRRLSSATKGLLRQAGVDGISVTPPLRSAVPI